jgi:hypothetical protein
MDRQAGRTAPPTGSDLSRVVGALAAVAPLARTVAAAIRKLALVSFVAAAIIVAAVLADGLPGSAGSIVLTLVLVAVLAAPGVVLLVFYLALTEVLELPARLRDLPRTGREHAAELARLDRETRAGGRSPWVRLPLALWRLRDFLRSSAWILRPHAPLLALVSPTMLAAVVLSIAATAFLVAAAAVVVLVLLVV